MTRSLPLQAFVLLFLLFFNCAHCVDNKNRRLDSLVARDDYSTFNLTDHHGQNDANSSSIQATRTYGRPQRPPPTVTTVIIIQSSGQTYHELGGGGNASPTSVSTNGMTDPNDSNIQDQVDHDNKVLKRLISISTVVGGVGVVLIIAGTVIFVRLRSKRRRLKAIRQCQHSSSSSSFTDTRGGGNNTAHRRNQSSSSSTTTSPTLEHEEDAIEMSSTIVPSAPPEPTLLPVHLRSRHQLSLSPHQQSSPPAPSAPSAKEIEMNAPSSSSHAPSIQVSPPDLVIHDHNPLDTIQSMPLSQSSSSRTILTLPLKPVAGLHQSSSTSDPPTRPPLTPELPPPAYTPSAPPLFILPPSQRRRSADQLSLDRYRRYQ